MLGLSGCEYIERQRNIVAEDVVLAMLNLQEPNGEFVIMGKASTQVRVGTIGLDTIIMGVPDIHIVRCVPNNSLFFTRTGEDRVFVSPYAIIREQGLRQALQEYIGLPWQFADPIISWEDIQAIRTLSIADDMIIVSSGHIPVSELADSSLAVHVPVSIYFAPQREARLYNLRWLRGLEVLHLSRTIERDVFREQELFEKLEELNNVQELSLTFRNDRDSVNDMPQLPNMPQLRLLSLNGRVRSRIAYIPGLENLSALSISTGFATDISVLRDLRNITDLSLTLTHARTDITDLEHLYWLTSLHVEGRGIGDFIISSHASSLEALSIVSTGVTDVSFISELTSLRYLRIYNNRNLSKMPDLTGLIYLEELHLCSQ